MLEKSKDRLIKRVNDVKAQKKQEKIAKCLNAPVLEKGYYNKSKAIGCGNKNCVMCGNPRKFFGEKTIQEKKAYQINVDEEIIDKDLTNE